MNNKVELPESVADHMYRMSMCCMMIDEDNKSVSRSKYVHLRIGVSCACVAGVLTRYSA